MKCRNQTGDNEEQHAMVYRLAVSNTSNHDHLDLKDQWWVVR